MLSTLEKLFQKKSTSNYGWGLNHCFACSQRIRQGMLFPEDQVAFCERCFHSTTCWCCHLPCGPLHRRLSDERIVCQHCYNTALLSPRQLGPLYEGTIQFFEKKMKMRLKTRPRLKVTDQRFLLKQFGISDHIWALYRHRRRRNGIHHHGNRKRQSMDYACSRTDTFLAEKELSKSTGFSPSGGFCRVDGIQAC